MKALLLISLLTISFSAMAGSTSISGKNNLGNGCSVIIQKDTVIVDGSYITYKSIQKNEDGSVTFIGVKEKAIVVFDENGDIVSGEIVGRPFPYNLMTFYCERD